MVFISVQDEWSLALKNERRFGPAKCRLCERWVFSLNYLGVSVELEKDDMAIIKRKGWPTTIGSLYHNAVRQDLMEWLSNLPNLGLRFHRLKVDVAKRAPDCPAYWLLEPFGQFDIVIPQGEFDICPECLTAVQRADGVLNLVAPLRGWTGHAFAHSRNFRPCLTYVLSDVGDEIASVWPGAFRFDSEHVTLSDQSFPEEGYMGN